MRICLVVIHTDLVIAALLLMSANAVPPSFRLTLTVPAASVLISEFHFRKMAESKTTRSFIASYLNDTEEQKSTVRKRNILVLVLNYLQQQG